MAYSCLQSPPKGKHRYVFILYPQHGRVNAKAPKTRQSFTLHQFEKVCAAPLCQQTRYKVEYALAESAIWIRENGSRAVLLDCTPAFSRRLPCAEHCTQPKAVAPPSILRWAQSVQNWYWLS